MYTYTCGKRQREKRERDGRPPALCHCFVPGTLWWLLGATAHAQRRGDPEWRGIAGIQRWWMVSDVVNGR